MLNRKIWFVILPVIIIALGCLYTMQMDYFINIYFDMTAKDMKTYSRNNSPLHYKILEYLNNRIIESPEKAEPALLKYLGDADRNKSWIAYDFLGKLKLTPLINMPPILALLTNTQENMQPGFSNRIAGLSGCLRKNLRMKRLPQKSKKLVFRH